MTLTLEVKPETEARLKKAAAARGVDVGAVVDEWAARIETGTPVVDASGVDANGVDAQSPADTEEARRAAIGRVRGMLAHLPGTVDDFLRERREEAQREMERDAPQDAAPDVGRAA